MNRTLTSPGGYSSMHGYTTFVEDASSNPDDRDDRAWLATLLGEVGPEGTHLIADLLGIDLDHP
ncbi:hypothetical protein ACFWTE_23700 [Nocardiopsis sp. NPDC058631]|uniref:hypothetical protein n=1 Tax=Nocardiopsis sp. NPDC058631 TaxID=3346566 RepID=UPI00364BEF45